MRAAQAFVYSRRFVVFFFSYSEIFTRLQTFQTRFLVRTEQGAIQQVLDLVQLQSLANDMASAFPLCPENRASH